jgi:hypothetical protein
VERKYHKFPKALLKEFRDVFDHISRCYTNPADNFSIEDNIRKAENHFDRIKLDTYKYMSDYKKREFVCWKKKYSKYDLQNIDNGDFWKNILDLEDQGELLFSEARKQEAKDINKSCDLLQESTSKYDTIEKIISEKRELIVKAKFKYRKISFINTIKGFGFGVLTSIVAAFAWENLKLLCRTWFH